MATEAELLARQQELQKQAKENQEIYTRDLHRFEAERARVEQQSDIVGNQLKELRAAGQ